MYMIQWNFAKREFRLPSGTKSRACDPGCAGNIDIILHRKLVHSHPGIIYKPPALSPCHLMGNVFTRVCKLLVRLSIYLCAARNPLLTDETTIAADCVPLAIPCVEVNRTVLHTCPIRPMPRDRMLPTWPDVSTFLHAGGQALHQFVMPVVHSTVPCGDTGQGHRTCMGCQYIIGFHYVPSGAGSHRDERDSLLYIHRRHRFPYELSSSISELSCCTMVSTLYVEKLQRTYCCCTRWQAKAAAIVCKQGEKHGSRPAWHMLYLAWPAPGAVEVSSGSTNGGSGSARSRLRTVQLAAGPLAMQYAKQLLRQPPRPNWQSPRIWPYVTQRAGNLEHHARVARAASGQPWS
jgi:hypothetical protein